MDKSANVNSVTAGAAGQNLARQEKGAAPVQGKVAPASMPPVSDKAAAADVKAQAASQAAQVAAGKAQAVQAAEAQEEVLLKQAEANQVGEDAVAVAAEEEAAEQAASSEAVAEPALNLTEGLAAADVSNVGKPARAPVDGDKASALQDSDDDGGISPVLLGVLGLAAIGGTVALVGGGASNKPPVAVDDSFAANEGSGTANLSVATNDTDPNRNDTLTFAASGTLPAGVTLGANGAITFDSNNAAYNSLAAGQTQVLTFAYTVTDRRGATDTGSVTLTVTGTNDVPVAVADVAAATEGAAAVTGSVRTNDTDVDTNDVLTYSLNAPVAGLTLNTNGTFSFDPANAAYNSLAAGQTQVVVANYTVSDGRGGTATSTLTITVTGTNDVPVAVADTAAATEGAAAVTGSVRTNDTDPDTTDVLTYTLNAPVAGLTLNSNGTFSFDPSNAAYDTLAAGQTQAVVANYTVNDGNGGTATSTLTITVTGTNDAPVITTGATATVAENAPVTTVVYDAAATDVDATDTIRFSLTGADAALLTIDSATGEVRLVAPANFERRTTLSFTVVATDSVTPALTDTQDVTLTVTNQVDVLTLDVGTPDAPVTINAGIQTGDVTDTNFRFTETSGEASEVNITNFGANDFIFFEGFDPADYTFQNDGAGNLTISRVDDVTGAVNVITLVGTGIAANAIVVTEADAEAALRAVLGAGDYFRGSAAPAAVQATGGAIDASGRAATITEDLRTLSETVITNFRSDDVLRFINGIRGDVGFTTGDDPRDLRIDYVDPDTGNVSTVILDNVLRADGPIVLDEATAEAAVALVLGAGDYFQFG